MNRTFVKVCLTIAAVPFLLLLLIYLGLFGYLPSRAAAAREFERRHARWHVVDVTVGGGDEDGCGYIIRYRKPKEIDIREAHWSVFCSGVFFGWRIIREDLDVPPEPAQQPPDKTLPPGKPRDAGAIEVEEVRRLEEAISIVIESKA